MQILHCWPGNLAHMRTVNVRLRRALVWYQEPFGEVIHRLGGGRRRQWLVGSRSFRDWRALRVTL